MLYYNSQYRVSDPDPIPKTKNRKGKNTYKSALRAKGP